MSIARVELQFTSRALPFAFTYELTEGYASLTESKVMNQVSKAIQQDGIKELLICTVIAQLSGNSTREFTYLIYVDGQGVQNVADRRFSINMKNLEANLHHLTLTIQDEFSPEAIFDFEMGKTYSIKRIQHGKIILEDEAKNYVGAFNVEELILFNPMRPPNIIDKLKRLSMNNKEND